MTDTPEDLPAALQGGLHFQASMTAATLSQSVVAARSGRGMTPTALQRLTGLSARTLRDIESGNTRRRYGATTLARLDVALGWEPGTAWDLWRTEDAQQSAAAAMSAAIAAQMDALEERMRRMEEQPPWAAEVIDAMRLLSGDDRARVLDLARRLSESYGRWQ